ncbi:unnamed protein product [Scytosiphon promiscuus]
MVQEADMSPSPNKTKTGHHDLWRADEMDGTAEDLDWGTKDTLRPIGNFDADYLALCRTFEVPVHPCLASRHHPKEDAMKDAVSNAERSTIATSTGSKSSAIQLRNYVVDLTTLRLMMEALKGSSNVDTLIFHNAGLTEASFAVLADGLQHTTVQCLGLDYNTPRSRTTSSALPCVTKAEAGKEPEGAVLSTCPSPGRSFPSFVREGSKLKALSLRGNGIDDIEAVALAEAVEDNTILGALNLFDNKITDVGAAAFAATLRINTVMRGLSLARNLLTSISAEAFGLLLAGGYEVLAPELEKRATAEEAIAAQNKIAQDAMKKKKDARLETRLPLSTVVVQNGADGVGRAIAGGNRSLAALNLAENRALGAFGAVSEFLSKIVKARKEEAEEGGGKAGAAVLQELNLSRCQEYVEQGGGEGEDPALAERAAVIAAMVIALKPTKVVV